LSIEKKYKKLDDISHILMRPGMYCGSIKPHTSNRWVFNDGKFVQSELTFNPAFLKIFDEILVNSVDESKREGTKLKTIKVSVKDDIITIWDDGGIDVVIHSEYNEWIPEMLFSSLKAGSNFQDDEKRVTAGLNGVGSVLTNVFSKQFTVTTCDGQNEFSQVFSNNMRERSNPVIKKSKKHHTEISYMADFERFGLTGIDDSHFKMIQKRVMDIAGCNPQIKVYFNEELISIKLFEDYVKYYSDSFFFESNKDKSWSIAVAPTNDGYHQISFVNSTDTYDGGTHVDYILNQIISEMREFFQKKYKVDVKPSEIKNHLSIFINSTIVNPSFSSQTKEKLITEIKDFGYTYEVSDKLIKSILKSEIVNSILDWVKQKKSAEDSKLARELNKNLSKIKVEKLIDAKAKDRWKCSINIFEGDSAAAAFRKYRDTQTMGSFSLKGKFINVSEITTQKLTQNEEAVNLMAAIGLKLGQEPDLKSLRYGRILILSDADVDGNSISALLINFFNKYWPQLFERGMVYKVETPIVVSINKKSKKKLLFYSQTEYNDWSKDNDLKLWDIKYKKGLAALVDDEYFEIINNPKLTKIEKDELSDEYLEIWFGKNSELRKNQILKN
jgi:DNA topoisomerase-2